MFYSLGVTPKGVAPLRGSLRSVPSAPLRALQAANAPPFFTQRRKEHTKNAKILRVLCFKLPLHLCVLPCDK
jgi:hypothetical protein